MSNKRMSELDAILYLTEACYPGEFNQASIDVWHKCLAEYRISEISAAFTIYVKSAKKPFLPVISEIITILENNRGPTLSIESRAQAEWRKVMLAVQQRGLNRGAPEFKNPITRHLVQAQFNWSYLCGFLEKDMNWEQKRWCEAYELASEIDLDQLKIDSVKSIQKLITRIGDPK